VLLLPRGFFRRKLMEGLIVRNIDERIADLQERCTALEEIVKEIATLPTVKKEAESGPSDCEGPDRRDAKVSKPRVAQRKKSSPRSPEPGDDEVRAEAPVEQPEED